MNNTSGKRNILSEDDRSYLQQHELTPEDLEIYEAKVSGISVVSLTHKYCRSKSSIYRLMKRIEGLMELQKNMISYEDVLNLPVYFPCSFDLRTAVDANTTFALFLCVIFVEQDLGYVIPRSLLEFFKPALRRRRALNALKESLKDTRLVSSTKETYPIFSHIEISNKSFTFLFTPHAYLAIQMVMAHVRKEEL